MLGASFAALVIASPAFAQSADNSAIVDQDGTNHNATITQSTLLAQAEIRQTGNNQRGTITQSAAGYPGVLNDGSDLGAGALIQQDGENNQARIRQEGDYGETVFLSSLNPDLFNGELQLAEAVQDGVGNNSDIWQLGRTNFARTLQFNSFNNAEVLQSGRNTVARSTQDGIGNNARLWQGSFSQIAISALDVFQAGDFNQSFNVQRGTGDTPNPARVPFALVNQIGNSNLSNLVQDGSDDVAFVDQIGNSNQSFIDQLPGGVSNEADINQEGDNLISNLTQSGTDGFAELFQSGTLNQANVTQGGVSNSSTVTQGGTGNVANVFQNAPTP
ncbi:hypothetical protein [Erythrobacter fulvus]|nr:hypothetical protein [Erythrobacter fulvus]